MTTTRHPAQRTSSNPALINRLNPERHISRLVHLLGFVSARMHFRALCALLGLALSSTPSSTTSVRTTFSCAKGVHAVCADNAFDLNNTNGLYDHVTGGKYSTICSPIKLNLFQSKAYGHPQYTKSLFSFPLSSPIPRDPCSYDSPTFSDQEWRAKFFL